MYKKFLISIPILLLAACGGGNSNSIAVEDRPANYCVGFTETLITNSCDFVVNIVILVDPLTRVTIAANSSVQDPFSQGNYMFAACRSPYIPNKITSEYFRCENPG